MEEKLNKLIIDIAVIKNTLSNIEHNFKSDQDCIDDHEIRIRGLESFKNKMIGALLIGSTLGGIFGGLIARSFGS